MIIKRTPIEGVATVDLEFRTDDGGFFAKSFDNSEFEAAGLGPVGDQCNISYIHKAGTLRGMRFQIVYVMATHDDPKQRHYLDLYKLGTGPLYSFYPPYHLCHFEVPTTVARAVLFHDATIAPLGAPTVEAVTTAKQDLTAGSVLDGLGGYDYYGQAERADVTAAERLLPIGVAEGCRLLRSVAKDEVLTYADVEIPEGRLVDQLRLQQARQLPVPELVG